MVVIEILLRGLLLNLNLFRPVAFEVIGKPFLRNSLTQILLSSNLNVKLQVGNAGYGWKERFNDSYVVSFS